MSANSGLAPWFGQHDVRETFHEEGLPEVVLLLLPEEAEQTAHALVLRRRDAELVALLRVLVVVVVAMHRRDERRQAISAICPMSLLSKNRLAKYPVV